MQLLWSLFHLNGHVNMKKWEDRMKGYIRRDWIYIKYMHLFLRWLRFVTPFDQNFLISIANHYLWRREKLPLCVSLHLGIYIWPTSYFTLKITGVHLQVLMHSLDIRCLHSKFWILFSENEERKNFMLTSLSFFQGHYDPRF